MAICTAAQAVAAMQYWVGYCEKASSTYAQRRDKAAFTLDPGDGNYTYPGYLCGIQGGAWCAMTVTTAIREACGDSTSYTKTVLHGVYPYAACNQLYDAAPSASKGRRGSWTPQAGDVIIFSYDGSTRAHTGMVESVSGSTVNTIEGNVSNKCQRKSYALTNSNIWGYVRPAYTGVSTTANKTSESYSAQIKAFQGWLGVTADGEYGTQTRAAAIKRLQTLLSVTADGVFGALSKAAVKALDNQAVDFGDSGDSVKLLQGMLYCKGINPGGFDGEFGSKTKAAVAQYQSGNGLVSDGEAGADTFTKLFGA